MLPILYSYRRCPYAMRARMALQYSGIKVEHREIELRNKPQSMLLASPKGTVPVLIVDDLMLDQSLEISIGHYRNLTQITGVRLIKMPLKFGLKRMMARLRYCLINTSIPIGIPI
jgi:glutaredoxin 2